MVILFWIVLSIILYHYCVFPILTIILSNFFKNIVSKKEILPTVSLIIAAYNEEKVIEEKIENSFELDYPCDLLEIIVVSDGSTDSTPKIVKKYESKGVIGIHQAPRYGKTAALNRATSIATGDILLFSDANSMYEPSVTKKLVCNFYDPTIGGVCGRKSIVKNLDREASQGDSLFWHFESWIKTRQSMIGSITTGDGEIFAIRHELYSHLPENIINDDTAITFNIIEKNKRVVYEPEAISKEEASIELKDDFNVKVRMVSGGYQTLAIYGKLLFPPKTFFSIQFLSHKVLRWIMPFLLMAVLLTNTFVLHGFYLYFFVLQLFCYGMACLGYIAKRTGLKIPKLFYIPLYYCIMNLAALFGFFAFLRGKTGVEIWRKAAR